MIDRIERAGPAVIVTGVRKAYGTHTVLDGVRLEIAPGTVYALLGVNGAGKTTLVNILSTLVRADAGHVRVAGADVAGDPAGVRRALSLTGQFAAVDEVLTGRENLTLFAALLGVPRARRARVVDAQLERFGLTANADQRVGSYSGGTRRRLDLAVSLLRVPEVLVLDEPTTGLDTRSRHDLWAFIRQLTTEGLTVLLTTQYLDEADALADRVGVLSGGRIVIEGTPAELKASVGSERVELVDAHRAVVAAEITDGTLGGLRQALGRLGSAPDDLDVQVRRPTLDDVFWAFTGSRPPSERPDAEDTPPQRGRRGTTMTDLGVRSPDAGLAGASWLACIGQFTLRSVRHSLRDAEALLMAIILPVMVLALFTLVFGGAMNVGGAGYLAYIVPGVIVLCAGFGSSSLAVYVATDLRNGIVDRLRTMPVPAYGVVVGHVIASVLRNVLATALVIGASIALGYRPAASLAQWLAAIGIIVAFIAAITWVFAAIGLASGSPAAANGYGFLLLFLPYLSSAFVPTHTMPGWLGSIAERQPMTPLIEAVRALLSGGDPGRDAWLALVWCAGILVVAVGTSVWLFGRATRR